MDLGYPYLITMDLGDEAAGFEVEGSFWTHDCDDPEDHRITNQY